MNDLLVAVGGAVKALPSGRIRGTAVLFSGPDDPDLTNEFFSASTDFDLGDRKTIALFWEHNLDKSLRGPLTRAGIELTSAGIVAEAVLDMTNSDHRKLYTLAAHGDLGFSSGSAEHIVDRVRAGKSTWIRRWPLSEISLTRKPTEPRATVSVKSLIDLDDDPWLDDPSIPIEARVTFLLAKMSEREFDRIGRRV